MTDVDTGERFDVQRPGGRRLHVRRRRGSSRPVLAVHGMSSTSALWTWVLHEAPDLDLVAADLSGRGASTPLRGTSTLAGHADDQLAVLDALDLATVDVVGMSLGAFVAVRLAADHPDRVRSLTLLDGGLPVIRPPAGRGQLEAAVADRLATEWPDLPSYAGFVVRDTAPLLDPADPLLLQCLAHDLERGTDGGRVRLDGRALVDDAVDLFLTDAAEDALRRLRVPARVLHAEWSTGAGSVPMYTAEQVAAQLAAHPALVHAEELPGHDHAGVVMSRTGAAASVRVLRESLAAG